MSDSTVDRANTFFIEVSGAGLPEVDGLFVPSVAPPSLSESGTLSMRGYWNGRFAWDRADGLAARSPALSYSNSYRSWRISRLDGHLAYHITCEDDMPPSDRQWDVYKMGVAPAPQVVVHHFDPRLPCPTPNVLFVLGGPGAGKGTMCELAELQLGWVHLSTGAMLRDNNDPQCANTEIINRYVTAGKLVPDEILIVLLKAEMERITRMTGKTNFLLDGFPRSLSNLAAWQEVFGEALELPKMLFFECPLEILESRILGRAPFTGRSDDNVESMRLRFETFKAETLPTIEHFRSQGKCIEVNTGADRPSVFECVKDRLAEFSEPVVADRPLCERAEILLGLKPYPRANG